MLTLSSTADMAAAMRRARTISLAAYTLRPGAIEDALIAAAQRGAHVTVRLEGQPYRDAQGDLLTNNEHAVAALRSAGADARLADTPGSHDAPIHAKAVVADNVVFLDDRNFPDDGEDTIVRDDFSRDVNAMREAIAGHAGYASPFFASHKRSALWSEARLLNGARAGEDVIVESESFGAGNPVYAALDRLGKAGRAPRLLVSSRDLQNNDREKKALARLAADGVQIRACYADEKFALAGGRGWLGSTNATAAFQHPDQLDWGARTDAPGIIAHLRKAFEDRWATAAKVA